MHLCLSAVDALIKALAPWSSRRRSKALVLERCVDALAPIGRTRRSEALLLLLYDGSKEAVAWLVRRLGGGCCLAWFGVVDAL
jgi:hypothetical protein